MPPRHLFRFRLPDAADTLSCRRGFIAASYAYNIFLAAIEDAALR